MKVLVLNSGSSSVKYTFFSMDGEKKLARGIIECIGLPEAYFKHQSAGEEEVKEQCKVSNHLEAIDIIIKNLIDPRHKIINDLSEIDAVGHRIVHGGEKFSKSVMINEEVLQDIRNCFVLAPLHNPHNYTGIEACEKLLAGVPQIAVFDTAFHHTIPDYSYFYALPYSLYQKYNIRRYGFHGTSHHYVAQRAAQLLNKPPDQVNLITCHLGNGCSITAIRNGISVDTSMGFTPLEGLVMGTRCGDIDPAIIPYLMETEGLSLKEIDTLMQKKSGLYGLAGIGTGDMRDVIQAAEKGNKQAEIAKNIFIRRIVKYIGA